GRIRDGGERVSLAQRWGLLLNDGPQCFEMLVVPAFFVTLQLATARFSEALETVMKDLDHRAVVRRGETKRPECRNAPRERLVLPVALECDLADGLEHRDGAAVVPALAAVVDAELDLGAELGLVGVECVTDSEPLAKAIEG